MTPPPTPPPGMVPLRVRARLVHGYCARDAWSPALDGVVAAAAMRERLGPDEYALGAARPSALAPVEGLPFAVERDDAGGGGHWWYLASSPRPYGFVGRERHHFHRRFDDHLERHLAEGVRKVMTSAGPYKAVRLHDTRAICRGLEWHAVGDPAEIERLLRGVFQVGAHRGAGFGEVAEWVVEPGDAASERAARLRRPLPVAHARRLGLAGPVLPWGLAPPGRVNRVECVMPPPHDGAEAGIAEAAGVPDA